MRGSSHAAALIRGLVGSLFPSACPSCGAQTDNLRYAPFCKQCWSAIRKYSGPSCRICAAPFSSPYGSVCSGCLRQRPAFSKAMFYGLYRDELAAAIHHYKFQGIRRLYRPLGRFLTGFDLEGFNAVIPVPLSVRGLRERGFNQSLLLAKTVSGSSGIPLVIDGLVKKRDTPPQIGLSAVGRRTNLKGVFEAQRDFGGMHLLLIDDVMTTGATANECSTQLLKAGADDVTVLTLARAAFL